MELSLENKMSTEYVEAVDKERVLITFADMY